LTPLFCSLAKVAYFWFNVLSNQQPVPMILFYTNTIDGNIARLDTEQARHCVQVLRKKEGDAISFVDGTGGFYEGLIQETGKKKCIIQILKTHHAYHKRPFKVHIAIAPTKNINRLEWFLEKATEIGIDEITPIICNHSERRKIRTDRLQKILIAAMKQSLKAYLPQLNEALPFKQFIQIPRTNYSKYIAQGAENMPLKDNYQALLNKNWKLLLLMVFKGSI